MKFAPLVLAAAAWLAAGSAQAVTYAYSADTTGAPTFTRAVEDFSALSGFGVNVNYQSLTFTVSASGAYDFLSTSDGGWDNFLFLYSPAFSTATPLVDGVIGNDDFPDVGVSGFSGVSLTAGTTYILVTTGFEGGIDFGGYTNSITGPGAVVAVPEAGTYGMMALGLLGIGALARRRGASL